MQSPLPSLTGSHPSPSMRRPKRICRDSRGNSFDMQATVPSDRPRAPSHGLLCPSDFERSVGLVPGHVRWPVGRPVPLVTPGVVPRGPMTSHGLSVALYGAFALAGFSLELLGRRTWLPDPVERYAHERLALFASTKHGRSGPRLEQLVRLGVVPGPRGVPPQRRRPGRDCACLAVNGVGKPGAGESPARFDRGRWRRGGHGEPEGCTHRETGGTEPGRLRLADQPAAYLTPISSPLPLLRGNSPTRRAWDLRG